MTLPIEIVNKIIMMNRPVYPYINDLTKAHKWMHYFVEKEMGTNNVTEYWMCGIRWWKMHNDLLHI